MYKNCKTDASAKRQRQLELALQNKMRNCRFDNISVSDLCDSQSIPRKAFYRYFSSKDSALLALIDHTIIEFYQEGYHYTTATEELEQFFMFWYHHRELLDALQHSQLGGLLVERAMAMAQREKMMPRRLLNLPVDIQNMAMTFSVCGLMSIVFQWHRQGCLLSAQEMTRIAVTMLTQPLLEV